LKAGAQGEVTFERGNRDSAEASGSQVWCAGTDGGLVGQKQKPRKRMFVIKKTILQGGRRFMVCSLFPALLLSFPQ
jgi:hypothetical protein